MSEKLVTFREFSDPDVAGEFAAQLSAEGLVFSVENPPGLLDNIFIGTSSAPSIIIKLNPDDFPKAHKVLEDYYKKVVNLVDSDYYLFSFKDEELYELLSKPDEWGPFDYQLAQKILRERGKNIDNNALMRLSVERKTKLTEPVSAGISFYIIGYLFIVYGIYSFFYPYADINLIPYLFLTPFFSIVIGYFIFKSKKILPDGERVFSYMKKDRTRGMIMMYIGLIVFVLRMAKYISLSF
jgi:hypothetical protein